MLSTLLVPLFVASTFAFPTELSLLQTNPLFSEVQSSDATVGNKNVSSSDLKQISITAHVNYAGGWGPRPIPYRSCNCGVRYPTGFSRIYNGEPARLNEFPWRVSINPAQNSHISSCAGALIHKEWVLTSASCVHQRSKESMLIDLGDHNLSDEREAPNVLVGVIKKVIHKDYVPLPPMANSRYPNNGLEENDIALLKLAEPIEEDNIIPICLPRGGIPADLPGSQVITSGWGVTGAEGTSRVLKRVSLTYVPSDQFRGEIIPRYFPRLKAPPSDSLVYTFDTNKGIYPIDHGTTMEYVNVTNGLYYAIGVADAVQVNDVGYGVKQMLGAWTDVTKYLKWIDEQTENTEFCNP